MRAPYGLSGGRGKSCSLVGLPRRLSLCPIVLLLLLAACRPDTAAPSPAPVPTPPARIISDAEGAIREVVTYAAAPEVLPTLADFIAALDPVARVWVATPQPYLEQSLRRMLRQRGRNPDATAIRFLPEAGELTPWARDPFLVLGGSSPTVLRPRVRSSERPLLDEEFPLHLARLGVARVRDTRLLFDGGDVVADADDVFVGYTTVARNQAEDETLYAADVEFELARLLGKRVTIIGDAEDPPPSGHIDLLLTPLGQDRILVGDPGAAVELVRHLSPERRREYQAWAVSDRRPGERLHFDFAELLRVNADPAFQARFDRMARRLEARGFQVFRIPILDRDERENLPIVSYNNVVMEDTGTFRRVFLPYYGLDELDDAARAVYESLGFTIDPVAGEGLPELWGAIRCLTNVLSRQEVKPGG